MKTRNLIILAAITGLLILGAAAVQLFSGNLFGSPGALRQDDSDTTGGTRIVIETPTQNP